MRFINIECNTTNVKVVTNSKYPGIFPASNGKYETHCSDRSLSNTFKFKVNHINAGSMLELMPCLSESLELMDLSKSSVGKLNATKLERFVNLDRLSLKDSQLSEFDFNFLKNQKRLRSLDISYNNLKHLDNISLLEDLAHLRQFSAAGNQLDNK